MDAIEIFKKLIGERLNPMIIKYTPYTDVFDTYPYRHSLNNKFESEFVDLIFDSIIFYAYEKDEIEKEYLKGHLDDLRRASRVAYENRVPKTERETDGLMGELTLDCFIKLFFSNIELLYSRAKYTEKIPHKEEEPKRTGREIKGYDGMVFSLEGEKKYFWAGQVKTGDWAYCLDGIKGDINKSIIKYYFADAIVIMCDIMRAVNNASPMLSKIINDINEIIFDCNGDRSKQTGMIIDYFKKENITIRIPCLLMPNEADYNDETKLLENIREKLHSAFSAFKVNNLEDVNIEVLILAFPLRDINEVRRLFLEERKL